MDFDVAAWITRAFIVGLVAMFWRQQQKLDKAVTREDMEKYVDLRIQPLVEAVAENTEAVKAMTGALHSVDKKLTEIEVELKYVKKNDD